MITEALALVEVNIKNFQPKKIVLKKDKEGFTMIQITLEGKEKLYLWRFSEQILPKLSELLINYGYSRKSKYTWVKK